jgi:uncharacterized protein (DUF1800 family)
MKTHPLVHRFRKIDWLKEDKSRDLDWLLNYIPAYEPIALRPVLEEQCMVPEDLNEQKRLYEQDKAGGYINNWLNHFRDVDNPLREYCTLFWHEHMPCGSRGSRTEVHLQQNQLTIEMYRKHALGDFKSLLKAYYTNPSCMYFLDIHRSYKENPNENFARELMELYTLGEGNYTLDDVKEVAKCFTGLHFDPNDYSQSSYFVVEQFDDTEKTILGKTGNFYPDDVIDILLERMDCAKFISRKAFLFFYGVEPEVSVLEKISNVYYNSGYVFLYLVKELAVNVPSSGSMKISSPIEYFVFFQRRLGLKAMGHKTNQHFLRLCGQYPLSPWSVAGWTQGKGWLEGEHLMHRTFFPLLLLDIANRDVPRDSRSYKINSRISNARLREVRFVLDAKWDSDGFYKMMSDKGMTVSEWLLGEIVDLDLKECLVSEKFQWAC